MIKRRGEAFRAAAGAHVQAVYAQAGEQSGLRHALHVAGIMRALKAMQNDEFPAGRPGGVMTQGQNANLRLGLMVFGRAREASLVQIAGPEVGSNGGEVTLAKERIEGRQPIDGNLRQSAMGVGSSSLLRASSSARMMASASSFMGLR